MTEFMIYVPKEKRYVYIYEGTGDNLLREDVEEGYVDYANYYVYQVGINADREPGVCTEDGGMLLLTDYYHTYGYGVIAEKVLSIAGYDGAEWELCDMLENDNEYNSMSFMEVS